MNGVRNGSMRIALFTDSFYPELGGIQDSILASARELGARGHAVAIFAPSASARDFARANLPMGEPAMGEPAMGEPVMGEPVMGEQAYGELADIKPACDEPALVEPALGKTVEVHRLFALPMPGSTGQSRLVLPTGRRWRPVARFRPDVIHSHTFLGVGLEALAVARRLGTPLVGTNHWAIGGFNLYAPIARDAVARGCWRALAGYYNRCDWVSAPSRATLSDMRAHGFRRPGAVISNPIDTTCFRPPVIGERQALKARLGLGSATILFAGRLAREKRIDVLLRALPALRQAVPEAELVLAGHGSARSALEGLARELGVAAHVRFTGTLRHDALAELCRAADVFALASTSESQSMVLLQAMSAGLASVGARHGPLVEYIPPDVGLLAEPGDPSAFATALGGLLGKPELRAAMGARATRHVARFGVPVVVDAWQDVYVRASRGEAAAAAPEWSLSCA
jgi:1,2-diacylglycerol 3-alpha-glucosyltransferase